MKKLLKASTIVLLGCAMMSTAGYAEEPGRPGVPQIEEEQIVHDEAEPSEEVMARIEAKIAQNTARLEAKKEKARVEIEARGEDAEDLSNPNMQGDAEE